MSNATPVIVSRGRRRETVDKTFAFRAEDVQTVPGSPAVNAYRQRAWQSFETQAMPTLKDEAWRRTDLKDLDSASFQLVDGKTEFAPAPVSLLAPIAGDAHAGQLILAPGTAQVTLDPELAKRGVIFTDLRSAEIQHPELLGRLLGQVVQPEEGKFASLAGALAQTGVLLYVPRGVEVEKPLHSLLWGPGLGAAHISHLIVWLEDGAAATYVHEYASADEPGGQTLHAGLVEVHVGAGANLRFVELQSWGKSVWNFTHERARVAADGNLDWIFGAIGGHLTKNFADLELVGRGATGKMSGFYFTDDNQHLDYDSQQNHRVPNTTSDLLFKGALVGKSRVVWQGMIYVAPGADKTDGYQSNRNLVLSKQARADSIPGLEILADDVRCTHGATVGKIDPDLVFFLMARGIPRSEAEKLIVEGFFEPIMERIPFDGVRQRFADAIHAKMAGYHREN